MKKSMAIIIFILSGIVLLTSIACFAQSIYLETLNTEIQLATLGVYVNNVWALTLSQQIQYRACIFAGALSSMLAVLGLITSIQIKQVW